MRGCLGEGEDAEEAGGQEHDGSEEGYGGILKVTISIVYKSSRRGPSLDNG